MRSDLDWGQDCQLRALLIGGGGQGDNSGGGSGNLKYINMSVAAVPAIKVQLLVGGPGQASTLSVPKDPTHGVEATALPGGPLFFSVLFFLKFIDLLGGTGLILLATPLSRTLEELFELTRHPSRALNLTSNIAS